MNADSAAEYLAEARDLTVRFKTGARDSVPAFRELVQLLLQLTVLKEGASVTYSSRKGSGKGREVYLISGHEQKALPLSDGRYLWLLFSLFREPVTGSQHRLKVAQSAFCYQADQKGTDRSSATSSFGNRPTPTPEATFTSTPISMYPIAFLRIDRSRGCTFPPDGFRSKRSFGS